MKLEFLAKTMDFLNEHDQNWSTFFEGPGLNRKVEILGTLEKLALIADDKYLRDSDWIFDADHKMRRKMVHVQEVALNLNRINEDWMFMITDTPTMSTLFDESKFRIQAFIENNNLNEHCCMYGGVKDILSISGSSSPNQSSKDSRIRGNVKDIWDIVRFRIISDGAFGVRSVSQSIWENFFDDIIRCRNYYFVPKFSEYANPYRAIHFEICNAHGQVFEVQVQSQYREAISLLDHAFVFKLSLDYFDDGHMLWMRAMSDAALYIESQEFVG